MHLDLAVGTALGDYNTLSTDNGPSHVVPATPLIFLGKSVNTETEALPASSANGDDVDGALPDDEDGVVSPIDLLGTEGAAPTVTLLADNNTGSAGHLFTAGSITTKTVSLKNATERAQLPVPDGATGDRITLTFPTIPNVSAGQTYARFRLSTDTAAANATGAASDGEVEDYVFTIFRAESYGRDLRAEDQRSGRGFSGNTRRRRLFLATPLLHWVT